MGRGDQKYNLSLFRYIKPLRFQIPHSNNTLIGKFQVCCKTTKISAYMKTLNKSEYSVKDTLEQIPLKI